MSSLFYLAFVNSKFGIDEVSKADILLIPGSTISFIREMKDKKVLNWIKEIDLTTQRTVTVCTGSIILAATGVLKNKKARENNIKPSHGLKITNWSKIAESGKLEDIIVKSSKLLQIIQLLTK